MNKIVSEETRAPDPNALSRKARLVLRSLSSSEVNSLFAELEKYDAQERAETFDYLERALNETRASVGAEHA